MTSTADASLCTSYQADWQRDPMRIVSWNMNHWSRSAEDRQQIWRYLQDDLGADLVLGQEAVPPAALASVYRPIDDTNPRYRWGSSVVAIRADIALRGRRSIPLADCYLTPPSADELPESHRGAYAVADIVDSRERPLLTAISLYGRWEMMPGAKTMYGCAGSTASFPT